MLKAPGFFASSHSWLLGCIFLTGATPQLTALADQAIYTDSLQNSWEKWGWTKIDYDSTNFVHSGSKSISVTITNNQSQAIYLHHTAFDSSAYSNLTFWINGGTNGGQQLQVQAILSTTNVQPPAMFSPLVANTWQQITLSLAALNVANKPDLDGFWIQDRIGSPQPTFYLDDIALTSGTNVPPTSNAPIVITVDALRNRHPINPMIYGVAFASSNQLSELNAPLNRSGGNAETRYNWQLNAHNRGADWYFESIPDKDIPATPPGGAADDHVANSKNGGAQPMLTIPMIGWVPKLTQTRSYLASYSITKYGPQTDHDTSWPTWYDFGNGISTSNNTPITWNDPNDANFQTNSLFQQAYVQHLTNRWGVSTNGGVRYYCMDNEHTLWHSTHRDVHPVGTTMQEIRDKFFDYAGKVKAVDPSATVLAPEEWGWSGFFYSGLDQQWANASGDYNPAHFPDRSTNGGWDYLPWFLDQTRQRATNTGQRLLDVFTVHYYPQGGEFGNVTSTNMQLLRNQSTRSLWDTNYVDPTWINSVVKLIPRLKQWVATYYPGTQIGITEYNWGAEDHINGATAQADIFGIFGREGLDVATRWTTPPNISPTFKVMKLFRNYDGNKSAFGDTSVIATAPNPDNVSAFAAVRLVDGAMTVIVVNKQLASNAPVTIVLTNFLPNGTAEVWQLTSANAISHLPNISFIGNVFSNTLPAQSVTLFVLPGGSSPRLRAGAMSASNTFDFWLDGQAGQRYVIQSSSNLANWPPLQTNTLSSNSLHIVVAGGNAARFYRAMWLP